MVKLGEMSSVVHSACSIGFKCVYSDCPQDIMSCAFIDRGDDDRQVCEYNRFGNCLNRGAQIVAMKRSLAADGADGYDEKLKTLVDEALRSMGEDELREVIRRMLKGGK